LDGRRNRRQISDFTGFSSPGVARKKFLPSVSLPGRENEERATPAYRGFAAAGVTYGLGRLIGVAVSG
jgi:hypothetical protein